MLNYKQIQALAKVGELKVRCCDGIPIAVSGTTNNRKIKYPYELFRKEMELDDLRLNWLLGSNNMIAGGSVLNWIWGENTNGDIDFFFKDEDNADTFIELIKGMGFKLAVKTGYATTYFEPVQGVILQVIGNPEREDRYYSSYYSSPPAVTEKNNFTAYGTPEIIIGDFDFHICKFAVDGDHLYTTSRAIQDLLKMIVSNADKKHHPSSLSRVLKYNHKGFFLSSKVKRYIKYDKPDV